MTDGTIRTGTKTDYSCVTDWTSCSGSNGVTVRTSSSNRTTSGRCSATRSYNKWSSWRSVSSRSRSTGRSRRTWRSWSRASMSSSRRCSQSSWATSRSSIAGSANESIAGSKGVVTPSPPAKQDFNAKWTPHLQTGLAHPCSTEAMSSWVLTQTSSFTTNRDTVAGRGVASTPAEATRKTAETCKGRLRTGVA